MYYRTLPKETTRRLLERAKRSGFDGAGEALFLHVFGLLKQRPEVLNRLDQFRNLYGFSRNVAMSLVFVTIVLAAGPTDGRTAPSAWWSGVALLGAIVLLYRYLKFFRLYSAELFVTYAELPDVEGLE